MWGGIFLIMIKKMSPPFFAQWEIVLKTNVKDINNTSKGYIVNRYVAFLNLTGVLLCDKISKSEKNRKEWLINFNQGIYYARNQSSSKKFK